MRFAFALFALVVANLANAQTEPVELHHPPAQESASAADRIKSRVIQLFYYRDARRVAQIIQANGYVTGPNYAEALQRAETAKQEAEEAAGRRRRVESELRHVSAKINDRSVGLVERALPLLDGDKPQAQEESDRAQQYVKELRELEALEARLRERQFALEGQAASARTLDVRSRNFANDPASQVSVSVVGEGEIHLRGPVAGINKIARMINQIDKPVGQVKVGIHTIQVNSRKPDALEGVHDMIDRHIAHSRFLTWQSALLYRRAVNRVANDLCHSQEAAATSYAHCFCGGQFIRELERLDSRMVDVNNQLLSIKAIGSLNLLGALYVTALASDDVRKRIYDDFLDAFLKELPAYNEEFLRNNGSGHLTNDFFSQQPPYWFPRLRGLLEAQSASSSTLNSVQMSTLQLTLSLRALNAAETELSNLILERSLLERQAGEIEERAITARRELEQASRDLESHRAKAEAVVIKALDMVVAALAEMPKEWPADDEANRPVVEAFLRQLRRLQEPAVQQEIAPLLLQAIAQSKQQAGGSDDALAEALYLTVADYLTHKHSATFNISEEQNQALLRVAKREILQRADLLRLAAGECLRADASQFDASQQCRYAAQNDEITHRRLIAKRLLDRFIDEQEEKIVELWESFRSNVANVDGHLRQMAGAFEEDVYAHFYKPAFQSIRSASRGWNVELGQIETTTMLTNDRSTARVSPAQTLQLDLPKRKILAREAADGVTAVGLEVGNVSQRIATQTAAVSAAGPAGLALAANAPLGPPVGAQLEALVPDPSIYSFENANKFVITPVIQPDGFSIAYKFVYAYANGLDTPADASLARIKQHFVEAEVQTTSYELREISRFRIGTKAARFGKGVPLLEDIPLLGALFRPLPSMGSALQENVILADCVVYPTVFDLMGPRWLRYADYVNSGRLIDDERIQQFRRDRMREHLLAVAREEVDELIGLNRAVAPAANQGVSSTPIRLPGSVAPGAIATEPTVRQTFKARGPLGPPIETNRRPPFYRQDEPLEPVEIR